MEGGGRIAAEADPTRWKRGRSAATAFATLEAAQNVRPLDIFAMLQDKSTGHSGAFARHVTLNTSTASDPASWPSGMSSRPPTETAS